MGKNIKNVTEKLLKRAPQDIRESGLQHQNVSYNELIKDPKAVVQKIYEEFGFKFTKEYEQKLDQYLEENRKEREAVQKSRQGNNSAVLHSYRPEDYGIRGEELSEGVFSEYI